MADNVAITAGSGTNIATDDIAGVHYQRMKLVDGTLDATTAIAAGGGVEAGALRVTVASDSTGVLSVDDNGASLTVDGTVASTQSGTWSIRNQDGSGNNLTSALRGSERALSVQLVDGSGNQVTSFGGGTQYTEDGASAGGETGTVFLGVRNDAATSKTSADGDFSAIATDSAGRVGIADLGGSVTVDGFTTVGGAAYVRLTDGTNTVSVNANGGLEVTGGVPHDSVDAGNPLKLGAKAESSITTVTNVADADRTDVYADINGVLITKDHVSYGDIIVTRATDTGGTSTAFTAFGATASQRNYITTITVYNSSTTNGFVDLRDGAAGTVIYTIPLPALGGATISFQVPLRQPTVNTALCYDVSAAISTIYISAVGFKSF